MNSNSKKVKSCSDGKCPKNETHKCGSTAKKHDAMHKAAKGKK